jgi:predicted RNA-binding protein with PIN domain
LLAVAPVAFLIDGYNLMYAVGVYPVGPERAAFDSARRRFLDWLSGQAALRAWPVRVVLDAQYATRDHGTTTHRGLVVTSTFNQTADDLIETLVVTDSNPQRLRVVSDDNRVRAAARRARCQVLSCAEFMDWLLDNATTEEKPAPVPVPRREGIEKPVPVSDEMDEFLKAFTEPQPSSITKLK